MAVLTADVVSEHLDLWERRVHQVIPWPTRDADRKWFRPPKGLMSLAMQRAAEDRGYLPILGDVYSEDTGVVDADFHTRNLVHLPCDGSVAVLHVPDRPARMQTLEILERAIPELQSRGFDLVTLSQLFAGAEGPPETACASCHGCGFFAAAFVFSGLLRLLLLPVSGLVSLPRLWRLVRRRRGTGGAPERRGRPKTGRADAATDPDCLGASEARGLLEASLEVARASEEPGLPGAALEVAEERVPVPEPAAGDVARLFRGRAAGLCGAAGRRSAGAHAAYVVSL